MHRFQRPIGSQSARLCLAICATCGLYTPVLAAATHFLGSSDSVSSREALRIRERRGHRNIVFSLKPLPDIFNELLPRFGASAICGIKAKAKGIPVVLCSTHALEHGLADQLIFATVSASKFETVLICAILSSKSSVLTIRPGVQ